jgi:phospholipase C
MQPFGNILGRGAIAAAACSLVVTGALVHRAPPVRHVFLLVLENESYDITFGAQTTAPYLARTLPQQGALLTGYFGIGHASLDNYIAMISGQAPNEETQDDCGTFTEFHQTAAQLDPNGQALGSGCVYPTMVKTIADQLEAAHLSWKGYMEDLGGDPAKEAAACGHPAIGAKDRTTHREPTDQYATKHNPFFYFHSLIDDPARCTVHVVNLSQLPADLATAATTPNYSFITPNLCHDGHDIPCVDREPGGLVSANAFLEHWVPMITSSPAFKQDGLLIITFDEGLDPAACCGEKGLPGAAHPPGWSGPGGGRVGAVLLSPFITGGTVSAEPYNHYSMLRWIEDLFGLASLGYAGDAQLTTFGADVFTAR